MYNINEIQTIGIIGYGQVGKALTKKILCCDDNTIKLE